MQGGNYILYGSSEIYGSDMFKKMCKPIYKSKVTRKQIHKKLRRPTDVI